MLIALPILWAIFLFGGFIFGRRDEYRRMPLWTRIVSSAVLVLLAWFLAWQESSRYSFLIAIGMTLGFLGDLYMADLIPWPRPHVLGGMGSFGLGHVAYISGLLGYARANQIIGSERWLSWLVWLLIAAVIWYVLIYRGAEPNQRTVLHTAALPYALLLASTVGVSMGIAWSAPAMWLFTMGAMLFLFSDLLIAVDLFNHKQFYLMGDVIWLTYGPAQLLIIMTTYWL